MSELKAIYRTPLRESGLIERVKTLLEGRKQSKEVGIEADLLVQAMALADLAVEGKAHCPFGSWIVERVQLASRGSSSEQMKFREGLSKLYRFRPAEAIKRLVSLRATASTSEVRDGCESLLRWLEAPTSISRSDSELFLLIAHRLFRSGRLHLAFLYMLESAANKTDRDELAHLQLSLGQICETWKRWEGAIGFYKAGIDLNAGTRTIRYLLRNNLGFSLNQVGRHEEAIDACRKAIAIDPTRGNAFKNLGLALWGHGRHEVAASIFALGYRYCPSDRRSLTHLRELLAEHPDLLPLAERALAGVERPAPPWMNGHVN